MRVKNQPIVETEDTLLIRLHQPYWGAWKRYGWEKGIEGFGLSRDLVKTAIDKKKKIEVSFPYGRYRITGTKAKKYFEKYNSFFRARNGVAIWVIPRSAFTKQAITKEKIAEREQKEHIRAAEIAEAQKKFNF